MAKLGWKEKRAGQGFSYEEVLDEMIRRRKGEYSFGKEEAERRFKEGVQRLNRAYRLSALMNDFLDKEQMTYDDLVTFIGTGDQQSTLEIMLNPVSRPKGNYSMHKDYFIHCLYPGDDIPFEGP